ncbi:hypothetical protein [Spongiimicrobium sp. 3-5]|uniref:hypothetical protein n=1 Tax=Spongiimicrobium sp. 3-5 TaxID=3332596 RepID=UPI00397EBB23
MSVMRVLKQLLRALLALIVLFCLAQCRTGKEPSAFDQSISSHFGDMHFSKVNFKTNGSVKSLGYTYHEGQGSIHDRKGKSFGYKWAAVGLIKNGLLAVYIGTERMEKGTDVLLTQEEVRKVIDLCTDKTDRDEIWDCLDRVIAKAISDCELSFVKAPCLENCWWDSNACKDLPD